MDNRVEANHRLLSIVILYKALLQLFSNLYYSQVVVICDPTCYQLDHSEFVTLLLLLLLLLQWSLLLDTYATGLLQMCYKMVT